MRFAARATKISRSQKRNDQRRHFFVSKVCVSEKPEVQVNKNLKRFQFFFRRKSAFLRRKMLNQPRARIFEMTAISFALFSIYPEK